MVTATQSIGKAFGSSAIQILGTVLSCILIVVWIFVFCMMLRAFWLKRLLWPPVMDGSEVSADKWANRATTQADPNGSRQVLKYYCDGGLSLISVNAESVLNIQLLQFAAYLHRHQTSRPRQGHPFIERSLHPTEQPRPSTSPTY